MFFPYQRGRVWRIHLFTIEVMGMIRFFFKLIHLRQVISLDVLVVFRVVVGFIRVGLEVFTLGVCFKHWLRFVFGID